MIVLLYLQGFTAGYSDKKNEWAKLPNPNSSHIMYIGFEYVMPSPSKYFLILYTIL